jgi:hypothetical protein
LTAKVFRPAPQEAWHRNAILGWNSPQFGAYSEAYRLAGSALVDAALANRRLIDFLIFPIVYNYRHAVELALKDGRAWVEAAITGRIDRGEISSTCELPVKVIQHELRGHGLVPLLDHLERRMALLAEVDPLPHAVREAIQEVDAFDSDAERFRYPYLSRERGPSWPTGVDSQSIDVAAIRSELDPVLQLLLDGLGGWLEDEVARWRDLQAQEQRREEWAAEEAAWATRDHLETGIERPEESPGSRDTYDEDMDGDALYVDPYDRDG